MTKAKSRHGKLKGAVLLMVLAVMTVLIILLAGTIAVVYSAHNRSMLKYEESQAYYTSRSVLDAFTESMLDNETDTLSGRTYYYVKDDGTLGNTLADGDDYTLGMAIEEDIFKLPISTETDPASPNYNEWFHSTFVKSVADGGQGLTVAQATKYVNMASTDVSGESSLSDYYDQYTVRENWTSTSTKGKNDTITYKVGSLDSYGSGYGKMTDRGANTYITVQVLEREYDLGTGSTFAEQFRNGNRTKDYVKCKATAHVIYDGRETTTSKIFITGEQNKVSSSDAIVSLSDIAGADTVTSIGGASSLHNGTMAWSNNTMTAGNLFIWDSVTFNSSQPNVHFFGDEKFVALGTVGMEQYPHFEEKGTIFYGQELDFKGSGSLASSSARPNIVSPLIKISYNAQNSLDLYGRVFADTIELVDDVGSADKRGFEFYDSVYMNEFKYHQNVDTSQANVQTEFFTFSYAGGTVTIKPTKTFYTRFQGVVDFNNASKVNVEEKITLVCNSSTYTINLKNPASSNYFGGKAVSAVSVVFDQAIFAGEPNEGTWKTNVASNVSFGSSSSTKSVKINYKDDSMWTLDSDKKKMSNNTLPDNLITYDGSVTNKLILPTVQSLYGNYMQDKTTSGTYAGDTFDSNGNFNSALGGGGLDFTDAGILSAFIKEHVKTAEMVKSDVSSSTAITNKTIGAYDAAAESAYPVDQQIKTSDSSGGVISTDTQLEPNKKYGKVAIDARSSTINIQLGDGTGSGAWGSFYGDFVVYGDNPVNFLIPATTSNVKAVFGSDGTSFNIIDNDVRKSYTSSGNKLYIGSRVDPTKATPAPNINMYAAQNVSEITFGQGCQNEPFQCYIYAPFSTVALGGGNNGTSRAVNYNQSLDLNAPAAIIGSAFCYKYGGNQKPGVVYIDPNTDDIDQSKPKLYWDRSKWISSYN